MKKIFPLIMLCITLSITACYNNKNSNIEVKNSTIFKPKNTQIDEKYIVLQHPTDRTVVKCKNYTLKTKDECAKEFEGLGYVRLKDKVTMPAKFDNQKLSTYPSRRWRDGENSPRW